MAPAIASVKTTLSYPLYGADFVDPDGNYLLVGGGGGESRSGVPNNLTLLDTSSKTEIEPAAELELSRNEDSVTSLAVSGAASSDDKAKGVYTAYAGINSSMATQQAGNNEHFRSFLVTLPKSAPQPPPMPRRLSASAKRKLSQASQSEKPSGSIKPQYRQSLFTPASGPKPEAYQRVTRTSRRGSTGESARQLVAIATGLAPNGELLVLDPAAAGPDAVRRRIRLGNREEAADVDFAVPDGSAVRVGYCTDYEVCVTPVRGGEATKSAGAPASPASKKKSKKKKKAREAFLEEFVDEKPLPPLPADGPKAVFSASVLGKARPTFRAIRFLRPDLVLVLQNLPGRTGAQLCVLRLYDDGGDATIILRKRLHSSLKAASSLDVAILGAPGDETQQFIVAVAGQDISIEVLALDWSATTGLGRFRSVKVLKDVHPVQMTKVVFSAPGPSSETLRLASVSMGNTVVVHTIPLVPVKGGKARYVLAPASNSMALTVVGSVVLVAVFAIAFQVLIAWRLGLDLSPVVGGGSMPSISIPAVWRLTSPKTQGLLHIVAEHKRKGKEDHAVVITGSEEDKVVADVKHEEVLAKQNVKKWEDMEHHERERWKRKLQAQGMWAADLGETVLKGVFFSELAGVVGQVVAGV